jgi:hypothetical protein
MDRSPWVSGTAETRGQSVHPSVDFLRFDKAVRLEAQRRQVLAGPGERSVEQAGDYGPDLAKVVRRRAGYPTVAAAPAV